MRNGFYKLCLRSTKKRLSTFDDKRSYVIAIESNSWEN